MSTLEWGLQILLLLLLGAAIPFALRLERVLAQLRHDRTLMEGGAKEFQEAARLAEAATQRLRASTEQAGKQVSERIAVAEPLRDDLRYLVERAESLADRLDGLVRAARPAAAEPIPGVPPIPPISPMAAAPPPPPPPPQQPSPERGAPARSQAERDLLRALVQGMGRTP